MRPDRSALLQEIEDESAQAHLVRHGGVARHRYSVRSGLSLVAVEGTSISLPATEITMAEMLREAGYATAMFGKWHLGAQPYSQTHFPNLPSKRFEGQSRIGQFGDSLMEGDAIVGRMLDALVERNLARDTIVVFASDNGPDGPVSRHSAATCPTWARPDPGAGLWVT